MNIRIKKALFILACVVVLSVGAWKFWPREVVVPIDLTEEQRAQLEAERVDFYQKIEADPKNLDLYLALGLTEKSLGHLSRAADAYKKGIEQNDSFYLFYLNLAAVYEDMGRYDDAQKIIMLAIEKKPTEPESHKRLANLFKAHFQDRSDDLDAIYQEAIERTRGDLDLMKEYARFLEDRRQYRDAWIYWQEVARQSPDPTLAEQEVDRLAEILGVQE